MLTGKTFEEAESRLKEKQLDIVGPLKQNRREVWLIKDGMLGGVMAVGRVLRGL